MVQAERAAIVFFRDVQQLKDFKASPYYGPIKNKMLVCTCPFVCLCL